MRAFLLALRPDSWQLPGVATDIMTLCNQEVCLVFNDYAESREVMFR